MNVAVLGLWHLGTVTAACLASLKHDVVAYDPNGETINALQSGKAPVFEPGLDALIAEGLASQCLKPSMQLDAISEAEVVWVTYDTPVDDNDIADVDYVVNQVKHALSYVKPSALILISSQCPVGTTNALSAYCKQTFPSKNLRFAYSPENLRLGKAIQVFTKPDRVVIGIECADDKTTLEALFAPITNNIVWMSVASAEMTKHALNAFLATSVVFINEVASLCEKVGADAREVERGLKTEDRIGPQAYLKPGGAIAGGTLARDVNFLMQVGKNTGVETPLFSSLLESNRKHKHWACHRLLDVVKDLRGKTITALGLTYKAGTDTLRRSSSIEICQWLAQQGARVVAYDPAVSVLPTELSQNIEMKPSLEAALAESDGAILATEWPEFANVLAEQVLQLMRAPRIFDATGFLVKALGNDARIQYFTVGRSS
jgi:UDPglucose 6-dehydrogenase